MEDQAISHIVLEVIDDLILAIVYALSKVVGTPRAANANFPPLHGGRGRSSQQLNYIGSS